MKNDPERESAGRLLDTRELDGRGRHQLLTSLIVPRPIGWISSRSADGIANLAPFSYFAALASTPMLVGVSVGSRRGEPKDTLRNVRDSGAFCVNVVTAEQLEAMNLTAPDHAPDVDEFAVSGMRPAQAARVRAPYVEGCPAVLECRLFREVDLGAAPSVLVIGEVVAVRLGPEVTFRAESLIVDPERLRPVGRLGGDSYTVVERVIELPRPSAGPA
jgi:flavin reductase (DIM6/NTAB) family NADH-FMN oxidoreductase RutF